MGRGSKSTFLQRPRFPFFPPFLRLCRRDLHEQQSSDFYSSPSLSDLQRKREEGRERREDYTGDLEKPLRGDFFYSIVQSVGGDERQVRSPRFTRLSNPTFPAIIVSSLSSGGQQSTRSFRLTHWTTFIEILIRRNVRVREIRDA